MAAISSNGLYRTRTHFAVELHPSTVSDVLGGVKEQLNAHLLRYVDEFEGVLVAYSNVQILTKQPVIHPYFPYFHLDVRADVLLFKPSPGMTLVARVNHLGEDYISALALGVFNVTIPTRAVMPELHFLREENKWIHKVTPQHQIHEHSYIVFRVEDVKDNGGFFQISGSMREPATGAADFLHPGVQLPEPPAGWPDPVASPREDEDGDVVMGGEGATPSGRGLAALAAATAAVAAANGKPAHGSKERHGKEGKDGKGSKREHGADGEAAAKKRRKTDAGAVPVGEATPGAAAAPAAAAVAATAAATPAAAAAGPDSTKEKKDKSEKKKEKEEKKEREEKKKEKAAKKKEKEEKKKGKAVAPALSAPPQVGAATAAGAVPSAAGPAHTTGAVANGGAVTAATPQIATANGVTPVADASKKKDKKDKKEKSGKKEKKEKSSRKEKKTASG
ncbi:hypothetical protein CHLRE_02g086750v5 [Chlamydomonas reinhardtii]|uniref:RPA43 OB domain-containing protein n=1 Tax=Chlamydomonas reinhardtii TaxID=3055 RepID=A0A2K3E113_CHLRE|nr:uncharacterized protein CHLRE_02g086750v5 [Chlamydomonas reinhardtii]PNW86447.1 hypothetical protein CHLRE_02g086750v5 [Chlamydomonas reinhardtii]